MLKTQIIAWLSESLNRLFETQPVYFKVWNFIAGFLVVVPQLPKIFITLHIRIPLFISAQWCDIITAAGSGTMLMSLFTIKNPMVAIPKANGEGCYTAINPALPFTAKAGLPEPVKITSVQLPTAAPKDTTSNDKKA